METLYGVPLINIQALVALFLFIVSLFLSNIIMKIKRGILPGGNNVVFCLRFVLGFCFAGSIYFAIYSLAGVNVLIH